MYIRRYNDANQSPVYHVRFLHQVVVVVTDPTAIKDVAMQSKNPKSKSLIEKTTHLFGERYISS